MGKKAAPKDDVWYGVDDAKKRKQIQDRLAQRARRERLAQQRSLSRSSASPSSGSSSDLPPTENIVARTSHFSYSASMTPISLDHALLPLPNHTIYSALFHNGVILGLACGSASVTKSRPALPHVPEPLRPTIIQLQNVHFEWIDRFPISGFRDRLITSSDSLSIEGFLADLFTAPSFALTPGCASWDPEAWNATEEFKSKWSCLFSKDN
ncbi:hypothetical protein BKA64DRAFT_482773 [Cadophora sp. MPI-SDFR-AT-0126]|nr:hypothetical protein BKA64DRAFT_482773 [Leotiomycetes sp. MPI-SDFR-AT-0126]